MGWLIGLAALSHRLTHPAVSPAQTSHVHNRPVAACIENIATVDPVHAGDFQHPALPILALAPATSISGFNARTDTPHPPSTVMNSAD